MYARTAEFEDATHAGVAPPALTPQVIASRVLQFIAAPAASEFDALALESSGTTEGPERRARHHVADVAVYRAAAVAGFARALAPLGDGATALRPARADAATTARPTSCGDGAVATRAGSFVGGSSLHRPFVVAAPERHSHPASSLGEMMTWLREAYDTDGAPSFLRADTLDLSGLGDALDSLDPARPIALLAVTSALLRLVDHGRQSGRRWQLPPRSVVVDTGGCKGYADDELSSQLYARGAGPHRSPPWLRTLVCDPASGREQPLGEPGLLRHVDLANVGSVVAVQTDDVGRAVDGGIELLGRAAGAVTRGCSLLVP